VTYSQKQIPENLKSLSSEFLPNKVLVFSIDNRFVHHLAAALNSIIENNQTPLQIVIFGFDLAEDNRKVLQNYQKGSIEKVTLIDVEEDTFTNLHSTPQFTRAAYGRFLAPGFVSPKDSLLYLDADVIILQDLGEIFDTDLLDYPVGGISNIDQNALATLLGEDQKGGYLDSGFLLFNVKKWQEENLSKEIVEKILNLGHLWSTPDNHGLNAVLKGNFLHFPRFFSYQTHYYFTFPQTREESKKAVILQFAGPVKPDSYLSSDYFKCQYAYHLKQTPFANLLDKDKSIKNLIKKFIKRKRSND
jgi:lipopolysaccharide biosynthesis glycosyltransferase